MLETDRDVSKYRLAQKLLTHFLGFRTPATYYLSLALVFTLIRAPSCTSRPVPFYLGTGDILFLHVWFSPCQCQVSKKQLTATSSFALLSMALKPLFPSHFINSVIFLFELHYHLLVFS